MKFNVTNVHSFTSKWCVCCFVLPTLINISPYSKSKKETTPYKLGVGKFIEIPNSNTLDRRKNNDEKSRSTISFLANLWKTNIQLFRRAQHEIFPAREYEMGVGNQGIKAALGMPDSEGS